MQKCKFQVSFTVPDRRDDAYAKLADRLFDTCADAEASICADGMMHVDFYREGTVLHEALREAFNGLAIVMGDCAPITRPENQDL